MSLVERYRTQYEYEKDCNEKMLCMIESVPEANRGEARFQQAVTLAGHLAACRENWLGFMTGAATPVVAWFDPKCELATLRPRFALLESRWTDYFASLEEDQLAQDFSFEEGGGRFHLSTEMQIVQLFGHACYHRGQVAILVDQLGGETVDTDYIYWAAPASQ